MADRRPSRLARRLLATLLALVLIAGAAYTMARRQDRVGPPRLLGAPLRHAGADGDAVFLLTSHAETRLVSGGRFAASSWRLTDVHVDLWRIDPATARPVWRRRLLTERQRSRRAPIPAPAPLALLGADGNTLWVLAPDLRAVSATDGSLRLDAATLEARTPALRGVLPRERRYYVLAAEGLLIMAADARVFAVDGATLAARPVTSGTALVPDSAGRVRRPAYLAPSAPTAFLARGLTFPGRWLGMLAEEEAERFRAAALAAAAPGRRRALAEHAAATLAPPPPNFAAPVRLRLWSARITPVSRAPRDWPASMPATDWGTRDGYSDIAPLPESPAFLQGGLLRPGVTTAPPMLMREPDGVLVLHRDRLGEEGRLRLTRVAGPGGRPVWEAALPLSVLQSVLPGPAGTNALVLFGREYTPSDGAPGDPYHDAHEQVVGVDLATGAVRAFDLTAEGRTTPVTR